MAATVAIPDLRIDTSEAEHQRLAKKSAASEAAFESALAALADPLKASPVASTPLFHACEAVARASGIKLKRPETADAQTLEGIAHASGVRLRRVRLHGAWWERDAGPL